jgi:hypothetical protein
MKVENYDATKLGSQHENLLKREIQRMWTNIKLCLTTYVYCSVPDSNHSGFPASTLRIHNVAVWLLFGQVPFLRENYVATTYFRYVICKSLWQRMFQRFCYVRIWSATLWIRSVLAGLRVDCQSDIFVVWGLTARRHICRLIDYFSYSRFSAQSIKLYTYGYGLDANVKAQT